MQFKYEDKLIVYYEKAEYRERAESLARHLGTCAVDNLDNCTDKSLYLRLDDKGLSLQDGELELMADLRRMLPRLKKSNLQNEMLIKSSRLKGVTGDITVLDATAGLGEDSIILAAAGYYVELYEYDPVIAALLKDAMQRAMKDSELSNIVSRMNLHEGNSIEAMRQLSEAPDIILLDPMFPERQKSASVKKKFQLLQQLESPCTDEGELLAAAMDLKPRKLIIKRPLKGQYLAGIKPEYSYKGKAIRYDCFSFTQKVV